MYRGHPDLRALRDQAETARCSLSVVGRTCRFGWILETNFKDVSSREFDEFEVNTHLCKLRCWHL